MNYTKGIWSVCINGYGKREIVTDSRIVAEVKEYTGNSQDMIQNRANAYLISASPDMEKALRHSLIALDNVEVQTGGLTQQEELLKIEIEKALTKAEGK